MDDFFHFWHFSYLLTPSKNPIEKWAIYKQVLEKSKKCLSFIAWGQELAYSSLCKGFRKMIPWVLNIRKAENPKKMAKYCRILSDTERKNLTMLWNMDAKHIKLLASNWFMASLTDFFFNKKYGIIWYHSPDWRVQQCCGKWVVVHFT